MSRPIAQCSDVLGDPSQWLGHALKYACRAPHKGREAEDLKKAIWCVRHAVELDCEGWPAALTGAALHSLTAALCAGTPDPELPLRQATIWLIEAVVSFSPLTEAVAEKLEQALLAEAE